MDIKKTINFMRENVDPDFDFVDNSNREVPFTKLKKNIKNTKLVLISSGGFHLKDDESFDTEDPYGDPSYRLIPKETNPDLIEISHTHYDHKYVKKDLNCAFPLELLRGLEREDIIGRLAEENYSFMGYCLKTEELKENAQKLARKLFSKNVKAALIAPT